MEAFFDNKNNVLNAQIRSSVDESVLYKLKTTFSFRGRRLTIIQDANPSPGGPVTVGAIHWDDRIIEILGQKKKMSEIKRHEGKYFKRCVSLCPRVTPDLTNKQRQIMEMGTGA